MPASNAQLVFCHPGDAARICLIPGLKSLQAGGKTDVFVLETDPQTLLLKISQVLPVSSIRTLLDRFHLVVSTCDTEMNIDVVDGFFDFVSSDYEDLIQVNQNVENIANLLRMIEQQLGYLRGRTVLDFGCGTGLAFEKLAVAGATSIGVDRCPRMRFVARRRGTQVLSLEDLQSSPVRPDAILASYVLHLAPDRNALNLVWEKLKPGGIFVANFHKSAGLEETNEIMKRADCEIRTLPSAADTAKHGPYIAYLKHERD